MILSKQLIPLIKAAISGNIKNLEISDLVRLTHQLAAVRLRQILHSKKIIFEILPHTINSIALDCIAEIFQRDEDGKFIELEIYFGRSDNLSKLNDNEIIILFRRLIFSKINDAVFQIYKDYDPITSKILRNLKIIVKNSNHFHKLNRFGESYIALYPLDLNEHFSEMPPEQLETELLLHNPPLGNLEKIFVTLLEILASKQEYRKFYSLIDLALIIKNVYMRKRNINLNSFEIDSNMIVRDVSEVVEQSFTEIYDYLIRCYNKKNGMSEGIFNSYFSAIKKIIEFKFIYNDGTDISYYEHLKNEIVELSYEDYRKYHRAKFEYFAKVAKTIVLNNLKESFC